MTTKSGAVLRRAVPRETWELNNDDVELVDKIGSGNFGDVYRARLRPTGLAVAVKTCRHTLPDEQKKKFLQVPAPLSSFLFKHLFYWISTNAKGFYRIFRGFSGVLLVFHPMPPNCSNKHIRSQLTLSLQVAMFVNNLQTKRQHQIDSFRKKTGFSLRVSRRFLANLFF